MKFTSYIGMGWTLFLLTMPVAAAHQRPAFDERAALSHVKILASDAMRGRRSGEPGYRMAVDYVVSKFKEWAIEPAGLHAGYLQDMTLEYFAPQQGAILEIVSGERHMAFDHDIDWAPQRYSGSGTFVADVVFAGYGVSALRSGYDDYAGIDVQGKIALFCVDIPPTFENQIGDESNIQKRIKNAQAHGARGVLIFRNGNWTPTSLYATFGGLNRDIYQRDFVILSVENKIVEFLFKHEKTEPAYLYKQILASLRPQSFVMKAQSFVHLKTVLDESRPTWNVLGKIPGCDKDLRNEVVILGAHLDHLGTDTAGDIFHGADDNASGAAVVMEAARAMKCGRLRPKRTIVFALWAAEEDGLLGSKFYAEHPVYPLEKTVAYVNLDMVGEGNGKLFLEGVYYSPEIWDVIKSALPSRILDGIIPARGGLGGSDQTSFLARGVPAFFVFPDGHHLKTHRCGDVVDLVNPDVIKNVGEFVEPTIESLASDPRAKVRTLRQENFQWRVQTVANGSILPLGKVVEEHTNVVNPDVDIQLAVISGSKELKGNDLKAQSMKDLLIGQKQIQESRGLVAYERQPAGISPGMMKRRNGKTRVLLGLKGISFMQDELCWAQAFSHQGISFVVLDESDDLFVESGLTAESIKALTALQDANVLLISKGLDSAHSRILLQIVKKPVLLEMKDSPSREILELAKNTNSVIGLMLGSHEKPAAYAKRLEQARAVIGSGSLWIVSEDDVWTETGKEQMLGVITEMMKAGYSENALADLFSGSFMRIFDSVRPNS